MVSTRVPIPAFLLADLAALPTGLTPESVVQTCAKVERGCAVEVWGLLTQGAGNARLYRWRPPLPWVPGGQGAFTPYGPEFRVDSAAWDGYFSARIAVDLDCTNYFILVLPAGGAVSGAKAVLEAMRL